MRIRRLFLVAAAAAGVWAFAISAPRRSAPRRLEYVHTK